MEFAKKEIDFVVAVVVVVVFLLRFWLCARRVRYVGVLCHKGLVGNAGKKKRKEKKMILMMSAQDVDEDGI